MNQLKKKEKSDFNSILILKEFKRCGIFVGVVILPFSLRIIGSFFHHPPFLQHVGKSFLDLSLFAFINSCNLDGRVQYLSLKFKVYYPLAIFMRLFVNESPLIPFFWCLSPTPTPPQCSTNDIRYASFLTFNPTVKILFWFGHEVHHSIGGDNSKTVGSTNK